MKILSLDIATSTGYAIFDDTQLIEYGIIKFVKSYRDYAQKILEIIIKHKINVVVVEEVYYGINPQATSILNRLRGAVQGVLYSDIDFYAYHALHARKAVLGRSCTKQKVFEFVTTYCNICNFEFKKHNDITDAILLAMCYLTESKKYTIVKE
jgi:Holliday junction resolvasome RuvABC endonuclease subunit